MPEKTEAIKIEEARLVAEYCSSDSDEDFEEYLLNHGSKEWVEYYMKVKAYKKREYKKGCIVN